VLCFCCGIGWLPHGEKRLDVHMSDQSAEKSNPEAVTTCKLDFQRLVTPAIVRRYDGGRFPPTLNPRSDLWICYRLALMNDHESAFVSAFIIAERRERYMTLMGNPRRRSKVLNRLNHGQDIELSLARPVPPGCFSESLADCLEGLGAGPTCYVIADASDMDGQTLALREAVWKARVHGFGVVLSCLPGRLCYYKPESPAPGFILERLRHER
jgi:hypothetical protein